MMDLVAGETVYHRRFLGETTNEDGHRGPTWAEPAPVEGVGVDQPATVEPRDPAGAETARVDLRLYLPPGFACGHRDRFTVRGQEYEAEGVGEPLPNIFTGLVFRTEVNLRRYEP